jgi:DNA modification methylase
MKILCKYDALISCGELKPHPKNRNTHPDDQIVRLAHILKYQGIRAPIIVSKQSGLIVKGHGTLNAIKNNQGPNAPVVYQDFETDEQEYAFLQSDNAIASWAELDLSGINYDIGDLGPDFDIDLLGIKDFILEPADKLPECDEDEIPDKVEPKTKPGDLYILGNHVLLCGDATNIQHVEHLMNGQKADMVFTDPPYGMALKAQYSDESRLDTGLYRGKDMSRSKSVDYANVKGDHDDWTPDLINTVFTNFLDCDEMFLWGADYYTEQLLNRNDGSWIVWDKVTKNDGEVSGISKFHGSNFELCWSKTRHKRDLARVMHKGLGSVEKGKRVHPTQKPVKLAEWFFERWGKDNDLVVDLYGGSGSTLIACEKTNRKCFMMEIDPHYVDIIVARWEKFTGKQAKLNG